MAIEQNTRPQWLWNIKKIILLLMYVGFMSYKSEVCAGAITVAEPTTFTYYLSVADFANSFIQIPTSNVADPSSTVSSTYLAGRAPIYNSDNVQVGTCSASFLCIQTQDGIYNDIANYLTSADGMIVTWFTPTTLRNLELDSIVNSMVTECMVTVTTAVGAAPLYGQTFSLIVSSVNQNIYFEFTRTGTIF